MNSINIQRFRIGQERAVYELIKRVYDEFVAVDYGEVGNRFFYDWIEPSKIAQRLFDGRNLWVAFVGSELVGVVETRDNQYISLLFVDKAFQGRGVAKALFNVALDEMLESDPSIEKILVHASPYSIPVYRKLGFRETGAMREENGIRYLPMEMIVKVG